MRRLGSCLKGLVALFALLVLVVGVPVLLAKAAGWPLPGHVPSPQTIGDALTRDGVPSEVIVKAVAVVIWVAWLQLAVSVAMEIIAVARHRQLAAVPGLRASRMLAAPLVTAAATLLATFGSLPPLGAVVAAPPTTSVAAERTTSVAVSAERSAPGASELAWHDGPSWKVRPRDTFWSIAEATLGTGERWREIERLNRGREVAAGVVLLPGTELLRPGWTLRLPRDADPTGHVRRGDRVAPAPKPRVATPPPASPDPAPAPPVDPPVVAPVPAAPVAPTSPHRSLGSAGGPVLAPPVELVRVQPGDTLSSIARRAYGDARQWPRIWQANRGRTFGQRRFADPNVILAGWVLEVPLTEATSSTGSRSEPTAAPPAAHLHLERSLVRLEPAEPAAPARVPEPVADRTARPAGDAPPVEAAVDPTTRLAPPAAAKAVAPADEASVNPWAISTGVLSAGLLATGVVGLLGSRRRRRLERAPMRALAPVPDPDLSRIERDVRLGANAAVAARVDVALRALAASWARAEAAPRPVALRRCASGGLVVTLEGPAVPPAPWQAGDRLCEWTLAPDVPVSDLVALAGSVPSPCPALVLLGADDDGDLYVDLEALGTLVLEGPPAAARSIARAVVASLAVSPVADQVHVVAAGADCYGFANEQLVQAVADAGAALELAGSLVTPVQRALDAEGVASTLVLRACQPAELWEPTVVVALAAASDPVDVAALASMAGRGGRGLALVTDVPVPGATWRLRLRGSRWELDPLATAVVPQGLAAEELADLGALLADASAPLPEAPAVARAGPAGPFVERDWALLVRVLGAVDVVDRKGDVVTFERSKALELVVWLAHHRSHPTRSGARTALWDSDVRAATFANIVSEARRALARVVALPTGEEWIGRTYGEELPLHPLVATDVELLEARLSHVQLEPDDATAIALLRDGLELVRDLPYTGTSYLWTDAGAWPSHVTLLVIDAAVDMANRCLASGDVAGAFWATEQGMRVLPAHDELVCLRLRAHAAQGNLAGVRHEFTSYERSLTADPWGDSEPSPKVVATRNEVLRAAAMGPAA